MNVTQGMSSSETSEGVNASRKWKPYPAYKNSGVASLGIIPSHWQLQQLKFNSYAKGRIGWQNLRSDEFTSEGPYLITGMHFSNGTVDWSACYHITQERYEMAPEIQVREGDLLITKDGSIGKLAYIEKLPGPASLNSHLLLIRPLRDDYLTPYLYYLLLSSVFQIYILEQQSGTTFFGITQESIVNFPAILPSLPEQRAIVAFLDRETARIDALIAKKVRLIELLQEKRTALISHAVTKGLDPNAQMKDSRVEWLGDIPAHWQVKKLKRLTNTISKGTTPTTFGFGFSEEGIRFIKAENIVHGVISDQPASFIDMATNELLLRSKLHAGDILMVIAGATTGKIGLIEQAQLPANTNQAVAFVRPENGKDSRYLFYWLSSTAIQNLVWLLAVQAAQPNLSLEDIRNFVVLYPPLNEAAAIAAYLDNKTSTIDRLIEKIHEGIERLGENRSALVSAAVTGKIDVREDGQ